MPFAWGKNDCCSFAADAVVCMTDVDPMAELRGRYDSEAGARALIDEIGGIDVWLDARLSPVAPRLAGRGDIVMFEAVGGPALSVVVGAHAVGVGPRGMALIGMAHWIKGWRV